MAKMPKLDLKMLDFIRKDPKKLAIALGLAGLLALGVYFVFILKPQVVRVFGAVVKLTMMNKEVNSAETAIAQIDNLKSDISAYREKIERYEKMLPAEQEIPSLLENLSGMARSSGVKIVGIMPVAPPEEQPQKGLVYQEIPILISAKSGYNELTNFLTSLENANRFMKVADMQIRSNKQSAKKHDVELLVLTYILPRTG